MKDCELTYLMAFIKGMAEEHMRQFNVFPSPQEMAAFIRKEYNGELNFSKKEEPKKSD